MVLLLGVFYAAGFGAVLMGRGPTMACSRPLRAPPGTRSRGSERARGG